MVRNLLLFSLYVNILSTPWVLVEAFLPGEHEYTWLSCVASRYHALQGWWGLWRWQVRRWAVLWVSCLHCPTWHGSYCASGHHAYLFLLLVVYFFFWPSLPNHPDLALKIFVNSDLNDKSYLDQSCKNIKIKNMRVPSGHKGPRKGGGDTSNRLFCCHECVHYYY